MSPFVQLFALADGTQHHYNFKRVIMKLLLELGIIFIGAAICVFSSRCIKSPYRRGVVAAYYKIIRPRLGMTPICQQVSWQPLVDRATSCVHGGGGSIILLPCSFFSSAFFPLWIYHATQNDASYMQ